MNVYAHFPLSFPAAYNAETNPMGWTKEFAGDWPWLGNHIRDVCGKLLGPDGTPGLKTILLRGYDGCRLPRWWVGETSGPIAAKITSGVLTTGALPSDIRAARAPVIRCLLDDGFDIIVHTGPSTTIRDCHCSAHYLAGEGVPNVAIDSSGNNATGLCNHQMEALDDLGVHVYSEPTGSDMYDALANVRFIERKIAAGEIVTGDIAWLNDPTEEQRADPAGALALSVKAGASVAVPWPILAQMQGVKV